MTPGIAWDRLDEFTRLAVRLTLGRFPDWEQYAKTKPEGWVEFNVVCPNAVVWPRGCDLFILVLSTGIAVGWDTGTLWDRVSSRSDQETVAEALDYAVDVVSGCIGRLDWYARGEEVASQWDTVLPLAEWPPRPWRSVAFDRVTLRTWSGEGDRDWPAGPLE